MADKLDGKNFFFRGTGYIGHNYSYETSDGKKILISLRKVKTSQFNVCYYAWQIKPFEKDLGLAGRTTKDTRKERNRIALDTVGKCLEDLAEKKDYIPRERE